MDDRHISEQFGNLVRRLRQDAGMSQERFAVCCGINRAYMGQIERGQKTVTIATAQKIAQGLGLSLTQLFSGLEDNQGPDSQS